MSRDISSNELIASNDRGHAEFRTLVLSTSSLLRSGLGHILSGTRFRLDGSVTGTDLAAPRLDGPESTLVLIDEGLHSSGTVGFVAELAALNPESLVVVLGDGRDTRGAAAAVKAGAHGYLVSSAGAEVLVKSLELIALGESVVPMSVLAQFLQSVSAMPAERSGGPVPGQPNSFHPDAARLSVREREILGFLMVGDPNKIIARKLEVAEATVKVHVKAILRKIGAANRTQAAMWASERLTERSPSARDAA